MSDENDKYKVEETVIVRVSLLGMAEEGTGTATFSFDLSTGDLTGGAVSMQKAFMKALGMAMMDVQGAFSEYTRAKYGSTGLDNPPNN